jgi:hypothetical protein
VQLSIFCIKYFGKKYELFHLHAAGRRGRKLFEFEFLFSGMETKGGGEGT